MAPPTATATLEEQNQQQTVFKMNSAAAAQEEEEMESQLSSLSRGPNPLQGSIYSPFLNLTLKYETESSAKRVAPGIPTFPSFHEHRKHIVLHMAAVFRNWARNGYTEGISGHISVRDPEFPGLIWMNPIGKHFALMIGSDMLCLRISDGEIVGGNRSRPVNNPGFYIHSEVHKARHNIHAICHAHTIAGRAWCAFGKPLEMITQDICDLYGVLAVDTEYAGIVTAEQEGRQIAKALGPKGKAALLINHGIITVGQTVDEASFLLGLVERSCEIQLKVEAACAGNPNLKKSIIPHELAMNNFKMAGEKHWLYEEAQPDIQLEIELAGDVISRGLDDVKIDTQ